MADSTSDLITSLLDLQLPTRVSLAGNGKTVVYSVTAGGAWQHKNSEHHVSSIWLADCGYANSARQLTSGLFNDTDPALSPDGSCVVFVSDRGSPGKTSAIYALSLVGGEPYPLTTATNEQAIKNVRWSSDGQSIAFLSADEISKTTKEREKSKDDAIVYGEDWDYRRLRVLHVVSRHIKTIASIDEHIIAFDWNHEASSITFNTWPTPDMDAVALGGCNIYTTSLTGDKLKKITNFPSEIHSIVSTKDAIYFTASVTAESPMSSVAVYKIDLDDSAFAYKHIAHGDDDCSRGLKRLDNDVTCYVQHGLEDRIAFVNGPTLLKMPYHIESYDVAYPTDSEEVIIVLIKDDINTPSEVYSTTASGGALVKLSCHGASYLLQETASVEFVSCETLDGTERLDGVLFTPVKYKDEHGTPTKPLATIISVHGGPYLRVTNSFNPSYFYFTNVFLNAGYAVMHPNYRGSSGRGESFADKARGATGVYDEPDVIALTQHCIQKGYIDKEQLIVTGWSQGGYLSYLCAVRNGVHNLGWKFKAAIPGAGVTDWDTLTFTSDIGFIEAAMAGVGAWSTDDHNTGNRTGSAIWHFKKAVDAKAIPPLLMLHGENDKRVPLEQSRAFRRALQYHKLPFEYVVYPREEHLVQERKHLEDMLKRSLRFVDHHLTRN